MQCDNAAGGVVCNVVSGRPLAAETAMPMTTKPSPRGDLDALSTGGYAAAATTFPACPFPLRLPHSVMHLFFQSFLCGDLYPQAETQETEVEGRREREREEEDPLSPFARAEES